MLIVVTHDKKIRNWVDNEQSGANAWGKIEQLSSRDRKPHDALAALLKGVVKNEALCVTGHGNDAEIGDEDTGRGAWEWTAAQLATALAENLPADYQAPILIESCGQPTRSFVGNLAVALEKLEKLNKVWIFGYDKGIDEDHKIPPPDLSALGKSAELHGAQVKF